MDRQPTTENRYESTAKSYAQTPSYARGPRGSRLTLEGEGWEIEAHSQHVHYFIAAQ